MSALSKPTSVPPHYAHYSVLMHSLICKVGLLLAGSFPSDQLFQDFAKEHRLKHCSFQGKHFSAML